MLGMILQLSGITVLYVILTILIYLWVRDRKLRASEKIGIGILYGICSVLSTHFGVNFGDMMLNVRDIGPLAAGLFFNPLSGILAGLIGGIERYIAGTYFNVGSYTRIACSVSTCLAGFLSAVLHVYIFNKKKPSAIFAFIMGAVVEVFHMYVVFITHQADMKMAFYVVRICAVPMILFTGLGMCLSAICIRVLAGEWKNPFRNIPRKEVPLSHRFQVWLFVVTLGILLGNFLINFALETNSALQNTQNDMLEVTSKIMRIIGEENSGRESDRMENAFEVIRLGSNVKVDLVENRSGIVQNGEHRGRRLPKSLSDYREMANEKGFFRDELFGEKVIGHLSEYSSGLTILTSIPLEEVYMERNAQGYQVALSDILLFTVIYVLVSILVQQIVVNNLRRVNRSLSKITQGDLEVTVNVRGALEFSLLSDDINQTVNTLKGYIRDAEKRIEEELEFARNIQQSALPNNFTFPRKDFELYAMMNPAKEVGGDFYDFFFVGKDHLALVIADVSGKGIPAALFMMRAKTAIRGLAESGKHVTEILASANDVLCEGNEAEMFVSVWIGIIDLSTGKMQCANAGHEYPVRKSADGDYELVKDKHGLVLAAMEGIPFTGYELDFKPGDRLVVYTDGVPEAINESVEQYGTDRLIRALNAVREESIRETLPRVRRDISRFVGKANPFDDITLLGFVYWGQNEPDRP